MSIGTRIRAVRTLRGLSSSELANQAGVSRGLISQLELDRANPSIETLRRIAAALDSPIAAFFDDEPANGIVVRRNERKTLKVPRSGLTYQLLTPDLNRQIEFILIELEPGQGGLASRSVIQVRKRQSSSKGSSTCGSATSITSWRPATRSPSTPAFRTVSQTSATATAVVVSAITPPHF